MARCSCLSAVERTVEDKYDFGRRTNRTIARKAREIERVLEQFQKMVADVSWEKAQRGHLGHQQDLDEVQTALTAMRQISYNNDPAVRR